MAILWISGRKGLLGNLILMRASFFVSIVLLSWSAIQGKPNNNFQVGMNLGKWVGGHIKYVRKVSWVYFGAYLKFEDPFLFVDTDADALDERITAGIPIDYKWISKNEFIEISTGFNYSRTIYRDKDYELDLVTEEKKDSYGIPLEVAFGLKGEHIGLALSPGYEINSLESNGYLSIRLWFGL